MPHVIGNAWLIYDIFYDAEECRSELAELRRQHPKIDFRQVASEKHVRITYAKFLPEISSELLQQMADCREIEQRAASVRRRINFALHLNWKGNDITKAKIIAKSTFERETGEVCRGAAVMPAY